MSKISVIIPAYNAARTLERAVSSVLSQTLHDIEVWIVDDGSTDETPYLADKFAKSDGRVKVIHQPNSKCYAARVSALRKMSAEYFTFVDADDEVDSSFCEKMYSFAKQYNLDIAQCDVHGASVVAPHDLLLSRKDVLDHIIKPYLIIGNGALPVWGKLYKKILASGLVDSHIMMYEDMKLNLQFFKHVERFGIFHETLYNYDVNMGSSVRNFRKTNLDDLVEIDQSRRQMLEFYGVDRHSCVHDYWLIKNVRNALLSAATAPVLSWHERVSNVKAVLKIMDSVHYTHCDRGCKPWFVREMELIKRVPVFCAIAICQIRKYLGKLLNKFCGR